jgi:tRNA(Ile)-lysidine synthase
MSLVESMHSFWAEFVSGAARPFSHHSSRFVVGVSGGADSLALLHVLRHLLSPDQLVVAHLNHGWRDTAVLDAQFVAQTAANWGLPYVVETLPPVETPREEAARQARYRFLARVADEWGATAVVVAHNADDQAETVLMHLLRGSGLTGLSGMSPTSPLPEAPYLTLLRPFLKVDRATIDAYCQAHALSPRQDSTNADTTFLRNRLRHELLPLLTTYNPQIRSHLTQLADVVTADDALLRQLTDAQWPSLLHQQGPDWLAVRRAAWQALPLSLRRRTLRQAALTLRPFLPDLTFAAIEQARRLAEEASGGVAVPLAGGLWLRVDYDRLLITSEPEQIPGDWPQLPADTPLTLPVPGSVALADGWRIEADRLAVGDLTAVQQNPDPWTAYVVVAASSLTVAGRRSGERFQPLGMNGRSASLKEVMVNRKISAPLRARWPVVRTGEQVVWLVGHLVDERAKVTEGATAVVRLRCSKVDVVS